MRVLFSYVVCPVVTIQREPVSAVSSDINFPMKGRRGMKDWARTAEDKLYIPKEVFTIPPEGKKKRKCGLSTDQCWSKFLGCQFQLINTRSYVFLCLAFFYKRLLCRHTSCCQHSELQKMGNTRLGRLS